MQDPQPRAADSAARLGEARRATRARRRRWLTIALIGAVTAGALYAALKLVWSPLQGAWAVFLLGGVAVLLMLAATTYTLRKRLRWPRRLRLDEWLLAHNYLA